MPARPRCPRGAFPLRLDRQTLRVLGWGRRTLWALSVDVLFAERFIELERKRQNSAARRILKRTEFAPCPGCGRDFENRRRGWLRVYCSDGCRVKHHNRLATEARRAREPRPTNCACGAPLTQDWSTKVRHWCSERCRRKHKAKEKRP